MTFHNFLAYRDHTKCPRHKILTVHLLINVVTRLLRHHSYNVADHVWLRIIQGNPDVRGVLIEYSRYFYAVLLSKWHLYKHYYKLLELVSDETFKHCVIY